MDATLSSLFIAGAIGVLAAMLFGHFSRAACGIAMPLRYILYPPLGGYVAAFVVAPAELYQAFLVGLGLDVLLMVMRGLILRCIDWPVRSNSWKR